MSIGKMIVILPQPGEVGVDLDHVADIDDQQEWRVAVIYRQRAGIILRLPPRSDHHLVPALGAAFGVPELLCGLESRKRQLLALHRLLPLRRLLGLQNEAALLVAVDAPGGASAIRMVEGYVSLEHVIVEPRFLAGKFRLRQPQSPSQPLNEQLIIGHFRAAGRRYVRNQLFQPFDVYTP